MSVHTASTLQRQEIQAAVVRCGCGDPLSHRGQICPKPRSTEELGTVAYWSRNPLSRWAGQLRIAILSALRRR